jgi:membrane-bound lytic murein transglycosylase D
MKTAEVAQRVNMSEADLRYVNKIPPNMIIRAGSSLLVPRPAGLTRDVTIRIADHGQMSLSPEFRVVRKAPVRKAPIRKNKPVTHKKPLPARHEQIAKR